MLPTVHVIATMIAAMTGTTAGMIAAMRGVVMYEPGDGLVTRTSQVGRLPADRTHEEIHMLPISQTFFLCESHGRLTHNAYFQNNLLYFLFH